MAILSETLRYLDRGANYLTAEQLSAGYLEVRVRIRQFKPPVSESYYRNPPQSSYGYVTLGSQEAIREEVQIRYPYQVIYRYNGGFSELAQLQCIYYTNLFDFMKELADSNAAQGPYFFERLGGLLEGVPDHPDTFRVVTISPSVFDIETYWTPKDERFSNCAIERVSLPAAPPPTKNPEERDDEAAPLPPPPPSLSDNPTDADRSNIPLGSRPSDFSERNQAPPISGSNCLNGARVVFRGTLAAGDGFATPIPNATNTSTFPPRSSYTPEMIPGSSITNNFGTYARYRTQGQNIPGGWYGGLTVESVTCL